MPAGGANIASAQVTLLKQASCSTTATSAALCTRRAVRCGACPADSVYGTPSRDPAARPALEGPVYLMTGLGHKLPDLVVDLKGQIHVVLDGRIDAVQRRLRNDASNRVPDAPVCKFVLAHARAAQGPAAEQIDLCKSPQRATACSPARTARRCNATDAEAQCVHTARITGATRPSAPWHERARLEPRRGCKATQRRFATRAASDRGLIGDSAYPRWRFPLPSRSGCRAPRRRPAPQIGDIWVTEVTSGSVTFNGEIKPERLEHHLSLRIRHRPVFQEKEFSGRCQSPRRGRQIGWGGLRLRHRLAAARQRSTVRHPLPLSPLGHQRLRTTASGTGTPSPPRRSGGAFGLPDGRGWEMVSRSTKTAARSRARKRTMAAGFCRPRRPDQGRSPTPPPPPSAAMEPPARHRLPIHLPPRSGRLVDREHHHARPSRGPMATNPTASPTSSSPPTSRGLLLNGVHCRGEGTVCPVANPPLAGHRRPRAIRTTT